MSKKGQTYQTKKKCTYDLTGEYAIGYDSKGRKFYFDIEDYDKIKDYNWCVTPHGYIRAYSQKSKQPVLFHHIVLDYDKTSDLIPDHINRIRSDNRKENLRLVTFVENCINVSRQSNNKSGYIGVTWDKTTNKWQATIRVNRKLINLGRRKNIEDALVLRLQAEKEYFGELSPQRDLFYIIENQNSFSKLKNKNRNQNA